MSHIPDPNPDDATESVTEAIRTHMVTQSESIDATLTKFANVLLPVYSGITLRVTVTQAVKSADIVPVPDDPTSELADIARFETGTGADPPDYLIRVRPPSPQMGQLPSTMARSTAIYTQLKSHILHEVLHAMKTDIATIQSRLEHEVDPGYHEYAHRCWNVVEDGAIETSVCVQPGFPRPLESDLLLGRRAGYTPIESVAGIELTAPQAIRHILLEWGLPHYRHVAQCDRSLEQYLDSSATEYTFATPADRRATEEVFPELVTLVTDTLDTVQPPADSRHDLLTSKEASRKRADLFLDTWARCIKPALTDTQPPETTHSPEQSPDSAQPSDPADSSTPDESTPSEASADSETADETDTQSVPDSAGPGADPRDADSHTGTDSEPQPETDSGPHSGPDAPSKDPGPSTGSDPVLDPHETVETPQNAPASQPPQAPEAFAEALTEAAETTDTAGPDSHSSASGNSPGQPASALEPQSQQEPAADSPPEPGSARSETDAGPPDSGTETDSTDAESRLTDADMREQAAANNRDVDELTMGDAQSSGQSMADALSDGQQTATQDSLTGDTLSGDGALDEISVLPRPDTAPADDNWRAITRQGKAVATQLSDVLDRSRNDKTRRGMTGGSYDATQAYKSASGTPGQFKRPLPGDEKRYFLVICLDRSGSMRCSIEDDSGPVRQPTDSLSKIEVATRCATQLSWGAEDVGIDVAVIDFCDDECRLLKPPEVPTPAVKRRLLSTDAQGSTPLSDALELANTLTESRSTTPLIVSLSDDNPNSVQQTKTTLNNSSTITGSIQIRSGSEFNTNPGLKQAFDTTETVGSETGLQTALLRFISTFGRFV